MRNFINIVEARPRRFKPAPVIDTSGYKSQIVSLMRDFKTICHLKFDHTWVEQAKSALAATNQREAASHQQDVERHGEDDVGPFQFDYREHLPGIIDRLWGQNNISVIPRNIASQHDEYQQRAAERHGYEDDLGNYIEGSDYLSGMHAMEECARSLSVISDISNPRVAPKIFQILQSFVTTWDQHENPSDGGEAPIMDEDFAQVIEMLLSLLLFAYSA